MAIPGIFDVHVHYPAGSVLNIDERLHRGEAGRAGLPGEAERRAAVEAVVEQCELGGIARACLLGGWGRMNEWVLEACAEHPRLFLPIAFLDLDQTPPEGVDALADRGFRGVKAIAPRRNYDDPSYMPLYGRLCALRMPILFHTGVFGGSEDYLERDPKRPGAAAIALDEAFSAIGSSSARMRAIYLDGIAVAFPELRIIGAHLGYGEYDLACAVARWRRNVYFDLSGGEVVRRHIEERRLLPAEISPGKLVFGSDCATPRIASEARAWLDQLARAGLGEDGIEKVMYRNAAWLFGIG
jgi:uncharacterized protein